MKILVINPGSTSIKYTLFNNNKEVSSSNFNKTEKFFQFNDINIKKSEYNNSFDYIIKYLIGNGLILALNDIKKIGIRIVHGADMFIKPTKITPSVINKLEKISDLAPLHNPPALNVINQIRKVSTKFEIWGVFDTSFHQSIPDFASTYPIPLSISKKLKIKKYGFHGIACQNILRQVRQINKTLPKNIVICHLGGGCSITAVKDGKSIDTSMGFTPLEGLMMTSRSGDLDSGIIKYIIQKNNLSIDQVFDILNGQSGFYGLTGTKDIKRVIEKAEKGDIKCKLALDIFVHRLVKYIYSYFGVLKGIDLITFSGGIGEGSSALKKLIIKELKLIKITSKNIKIIHVNEAIEIYKSIA